jgi:predicted N-acetyltransferase YhbS
MIIRTENKQDFASVYELNKQAFGQTEESDLVDKLRESDRFVPELSLVAKIDSKIVGHILFTKVFIRSEGINKESLALAPMAVLPELQKEGIGKQLTKRGIEKAKSLGYESIVVLGHAEYYPKFGFMPASKFGITAPWKVPDEVFMALELKDDALKNVSGMINYAQAFMEL